MNSSIAASAPTRTAWATLPRKAPARSPVDDLLGERFSGSFTRSNIERLRAHVAACIPPLPHAALDRFLGGLMDNDAIVSAYFRPTRICMPQARKPLVQLVLPFDFALEAARKAAAMPALLPQERALAWLAAFTYPVAHFYAADPGACASALTECPSSERLALLRITLLEDALRSMGRQHVELRDTMAAVMGAGLTEACDAQQVARLITAVHLATLRVDQLWKEVGFV